MVDSGSTSPARVAVALPVVPRDPRRVVLALVGLVAVALGAIGAVVPGMPTTVFLIVASYCFTKSCPWLEDKLLRTKLFAPYMRVLDASGPLSRKARTTALVSMWSCVTVSLTILYAGGRLTPLVGGVVGTLVVVGTISILLFRRR
ncbi:MAG: YbaN family protein [Vicinamibacterales bacterium]